MVSLARETLTNISEKGTLNFSALADTMKISPYYAHLICRSLNKDGYIVMDDNGKCEITPKGRNFLNGNNAGT